MPFEAAIIERYRRRECSVEEALIETYLAGVSVRRVKDITEALCGTRVSPGTISNLNQKAYEHWSRIRTNNTIERLNREIRRRIKVAGTFPDGNSAIMLVCARLRYVANSQWGAKRYLNMKHLDYMDNVENQESYTG